MERAAKNLAYRDDDEGQYHLACLFATGSLTLQKDLAAAYFYFRMSAAKGYPKAQEKVQLLEAALPRGMLEYVQKCLENANRETIFHTLNIKKLGGGKYKKLENLNVFL